MASAVMCRVDARMRSDLCSSRLPALTCAQNRDTPCLPAPCSSPLAAPIALVVTSSISVQLAPRKVCARRNVTVKAGFIGSANNLVRLPQGPWTASQQHAMRCLRCVHSCTIYAAVRSGAAEGPALPHVPNFSFLQPLSIGRTRARDADHGGRDHADARGRPIRPCPDREPACNSRPGPQGARRGRQVGRPRRCSSASCLMLTD